MGIMSKVSYISDKKCDGTLWSVRDMLRDALDDPQIIDGTFNKTLLLKLDDKNDAYTVGFSQAGMSMSQCLALARVAEAMFLEEMGY